LTSNNISDRIRGVRLRVTLAALAVLTHIPPPAAAQAIDALDPGVLRAARLLVISPHPDDGALGGGGLIAHVLAGGGQVGVVQITSGDAFANGVKAEIHIEAPTADDYRRYGALREHESVAALAQLGVHRRSITFLGFPDDGLCRLVSDYRSAAARAFESPYTRRVSPPFPEQMGAGVAYRGEDAERELARIITAFRPTLVLMPDAHDEHPDHCSTHLLAHEALDAAIAGAPGLRPRVLHYLIHYGSWPAPEVAGPGLMPPMRPALVGVRWRSLALTSSDLARKKKALAAYRSQVLAVGATMTSFERENELFAEGDPDGAAPCWCRGIDVAAAPWSQRVHAAPARP
jgi:LmbE family N-acetylglucosaminyl deacetylase